MTSKTKLHCNDSLLQTIGEFGRFQKSTLLKLSILHALSAFNTLGYLFWAARTNHWCDVEKPNPLKNVTDARWNEVVIPKGK